MPEEFDKNPKDIKGLYDLSALRPWEQGRRRVMQLELLDEFIKLYTALDSIRFKYPTPEGLKEVQKLKQRLGIIIDVLGEPPISDPVHRLIGDLLSDSAEELKAIEKQNTRSRAYWEGKDRGFAAQAESWLKELDTRPEWLEGVTRGNRINWKVSADAIAAELMRLGYVQYDKEIDRIKPLNVIPSIRNINEIRKKKRKLGR